MMAERLFSNRQTVTDWFADLYQSRLEHSLTPMTALREVGEDAAAILRDATGRDFQVRQVIPPPTNPPPPRQLRPRRADGWPHRGGGYGAA